MTNNTSRQISSLISVCCSDDAKTFEITSKLIVENIHSLHYEVVVPDQEVALFQEISAKPFTVVGESFYLKEKNLAWLKGYLPKGLKQYAGWYLQQFIKIAAIKNKSANDIVLVWDADTAPLKPLTFIDTSGKLLYYKSDENHEPYFIAIQNLLALKKIVDFSFIAQCFVTKVQWVNDFCDLIERQNGKQWMDAIVSKVDFNESSGFSEYESLGTFLTHYYRREILFLHNKWCRYGNSLIGGINKLSDERVNSLSKQYDFISFEDWDNGQWINMIRGLIESRLPLLPKIIYRVRYLMRRE